MIASNVDDVTDGCSSMKIVETSLVSSASEALSASVDDFDVLVAADAEKLDDFDLLVAADAEEEDEFEFM